MHGPLTTDDAATPAARYRPLLWVALAVGAGVVADSLADTRIELPFTFWWCGAAATLAIAWFAHRRRSGLAASLLVLIAAA